MSIITINNCQRCGAVHSELELQAFTRPICYLGLPIGTHWAMCPTMKEPIIVLATYLQPGEQDKPKK